MTIFGRTHSLSMPARILHPNVDNEVARQRIEYENIINLFPSLETMLEHPNGTIHVGMTTDDKLHIHDYNQITFGRALEGVSKNVTHHVGKLTHNITGNNGGFTNGMYNETNSGFIWCTLLESNDAVGINVVLENAHIPDGVEVHLFNLNGHYDLHLQHRVEHAKVYSKTMQGQIALLGVAYKGKCRLQYSNFVNISDVGSNRAS